MRPTENPDIAAAHPPNFRRIAILLASLSGVWALLVAVTCRAALGLINALVMRPVQVDLVFATMLMHGAAAGAMTLVLLALRRRQSVGRWWPRLLLLMFVLLLVLSADRLAGYFFPPTWRDATMFIHHPRRGFALQRDTVIGEGDGQMRFDRFGFRGPPVPASKPQDEYRVLFLGDSIIFGYLLPDGETAVDDVRRHIEARGAPRPVRCLNGGVPGYTTWQELDLLRHEGRAAEPDLLVLVFYVNDMLDMVGVEPGVVRGRRWDIGLPASSHWSGIVRMTGQLLAKRAQAAVAAQRVWVAPTMFEPGNPGGLRHVEDIYRDPPLPAITDAWDKVLGQLDEIASVCRSMGVDLIMVHWPDAQELSKTPAQRYPSQITQKWAASRGLPYINLTAALLTEAKRDPGGIDGLFFDGTHPRRRATQALAEALTDAVYRFGLKEATHVLED